MLLFCCLSCHSSVLPSAPPKQHTGSHVRLQCRRRCAGQHRMRLEICMQGFCYVRPGRADIVLGPNTLMRTLSQAKACTHTYTHIHLDPSLHFSSYTHTHTLRDTSIYAKARGSVTTSKIERVAAGENCCSTSVWRDDIRGVGGGGVSGPGGKGVGGRGQDKRGRNPVGRGRLAPIINNPDVMA